MRLLITTPTTVVVDDPDVVALRAEDDSGSFGILQGHADFRRCFQETLGMFGAEDCQRDAADRLHSQ